MKSLNWASILLRVFIQPFCLCYRQSYSMDLYMDIVWGCVGVGNYVFHH